MYTLDKPVRIFVNRRKTGWQFQHFVSSPVTSVIQRPVSSRKTLSRIPRQHFRDMLFGWKIFYLSISFIISCGLLAVVLVPIKDQDDRNNDVGIQRHHRDIRNTEKHSTTYNQQHNVSNLSTDDLLKYPRILDFCHSPDNGVTGMEGFAPPGFELQQVHIILGPGQKIYKSTVEDPSLPSNINCHYYGNGYTHSKIQSFQHAANMFSGMNSVKGSFQKYLPSKNECKHEQLSPLGMMQNINLGKFFQEIYIRRWKLEKSKSKPKRLSVKSVLRKSSYQSVIAFLHGFLSEKQFLNMKISEAEDNFCEKDSNVICSCPKSKKGHEYLKTVIENGKSFKREENVDDKIKTDINWPPESKVTAKEILHYLTSYICNKKQQPCSHSLCPHISVSNLDNVIKTFDKVTENLSQNEHFIDFVNFFMHPFINLLSHRLKRAKSLFEQIYIYSADESFILYLLTAIRYQVQRAIRPASRVVFELYRNTASEIKPYYLRVLFNGEDITNDIPLCYSHLIHGLCKLKYFIDYHAIESQNNFPYNSYAKMCSKV